MACRSYWRNNLGSCVLHGQTDRYSFFRGGGLGGRPRTPKDLPLWGRPSGLRVGSGRYDSAGRPDYWEEDRRFEEIDSDEDDGRGVGLQGDILSDKLRFTGIDMGRRRRKYDVPMFSGSSDEREDSNDRAGASLQIALRDKEELLVQKALERIRRAQILGKKNVKLTQPELDALERKRRKEQILKEQAQRRVSESNLKVDQRRRVSNPVRGNTKKAGLIKGRSIGSYMDHDDESPPRSRRGTPPGILVAGQSSVVGFSPLDQYAPSAMSPKHASRRLSRPGSSRVMAQPSYVLPRSDNDRYVASSGSRQDLPTATAANHLRSLPDDPGWLPRPRSSSSVAGSTHPPDPFRYQVYSPSTPQLSPRNNPYNQGRRIVSSPYPDVHYPQTQDGAQWPLTDASLSRGSLLHTRRPDSDSDSPSEDGEDSGAEVDVAQGHQGFDVSARADDSRTFGSRRDLR